MSTISKILSAPPDNFSTTLSAGITSSAISIPLNDVTGLGTEGVGVIYAKDSSGAITTSTIEFVHWTNTSGNNLTLTDTGDRGITGSANGAQAHSAGDTFEVWVHSSYYLNGFAAVEHNTDGTHSDITADSATVTGAITGASVNIGSTIAVTGTLDEDDMASDSATKLATQQSIKAYVDSVAGGGGWTAYSAVVPTRASADDPTYVLTFAGVDLTSLIGVGMRIKWTQNSTVRYAIVTAISFSTNTTMTVYGGTDYDVDDTATYTISAFNYSTAKAPTGFPLSPLKWSTESTSTSSLSQATPTQNTWYNLGTYTFTIPIGLWSVEYFVVQQANEATAGTVVTVKTTLSTANNSESDADFTTCTVDISQGAGSAMSSNASKRKVISLASKTIYYLNALTTETGIDSILHRGDLAKSIIRATCAYL